MNNNAINRQERSPYLQLFLIVGTLIAVLWGAIYFDLERSRNEFFAKSRDDLTNLTLAFAKEIESSVKTIDVTLLDLREHWTGNQSQFASTLRQRQNYLESELAFQVAVIDKNGMMVFSSLDQTAKPVDLSDREHFLVHKLRSTDELFISKPLLGRVSNRWSIQFTRPMYDKNNRFSGVLVLSVAPEYFYHFYRTITLPQDSVISVIRSSGEVLSRFPSPDLAMGKNFDRPPFLERLAPAVGIFQRVSQVDGIERLYAWRKVERNGLIVVVGHATSTHYALYSQQKSKEFLAGAGGTVLLLFVGYLQLLTIKQRHRAAKELATSEERWRVALEAVGDGVWDWNIQENRVDFSNGWKAMLGFKPDEIENKLEEWRKRVHPDDLPRAMHDISEHFNGNTNFYACEQRIRCKDGNWKWVLSRGMLIQRDKHGAPQRMVGTHTDISSRKKMEEKLKSLATTDSLTGLNNRRQFLERLDNEMARVARYPGTQASLLMADLDFFKRVNDTHGHAVGDAALKHFARLLRGSVRQSDFAGRLGGEEFAVLLPETSLEDAVQFAQRFGARFREAPLHINGKTIPMTVSIGATALEASDAGADRALQRADEAMYEAKLAGRDRVVAKKAAPAVQTCPADAAAQ